jgi:hypothetical protein
VPEHYCKETKKWVYSSCCEKFCLCYFPSLFHGCGCDSGHCEPPYSRRYLVKKPRVCKEDAVKCVLAPAGCAAGPCCAPAPVYFPNTPAPQNNNAAPQNNNGAAMRMPVAAPRYTSPMPVSYGSPEMPPSAFGGGSAFTPAAPPPGAFGTPATAFSPR